MDAHFLIKIYTCGCKDLTFMDKEGRRQDASERFVGLKSVAYRRGVGGFKPPRNSEDPPKSCRTQPDCENC